MRHDDMRAVAAGTPCTEGARSEAKQLLALLADCTFAAADPRVGDDLVSNLDAGRARAERRDFAGNLVAHREGQMHATRLQRDLLPVTEIEMPVPDMHIAMA